MFCLHIWNVNVCMNVCTLCLADLLFVQGTEVIFKVALCLLSSHEGEILECDSFESIVDYLKTTIPALTQNQMEETISKVKREIIFVFFSERVSQKATPCLHAV